LQAIKPDMTHKTSWRNVIGIEHTAGAVFVVFWLVLPFTERKNFILFSQKHIIVLYLQTFNTKNFILFKISALGLFLKYS
jgi:hypothetical protein